MLIISCGAFVKLVGSGDGEYTYILLLPTPPEAAPNRGLARLIQQREAAYIRRGDREREPRREANFEVDVAVLGVVGALGTLVVLGGVVCEAEVDNVLVAADLAAH